jgi:predicted dehydrogenase
VWTNRPIWPQGIDRPAPAPVPSNLHWDLWLGPAPIRPYGEGYHTFSWRGWWDFGTGAPGDMGCHTVNLPFMALDLRNPRTIEATTSPDNHDSYPKSSTVRYEFPANHHRPALSMTWYDGGNLPPADLLPGQSFSDSGSLIIGDKGKLYTPGDYGGGGTFIGGVDVGSPAFPESPGHFEEYVRAIRGGPAAMSNFHDYAAPLAETVILANIAVWSAGKKIEWEAHKMRTRNAPETEHILRPAYRAGYQI